jgi:hypothetical protein
VSNATNNPSTFTTAGREREAEARSGVHVLRRRRQSVSASLAGRAGSHSAIVGVPISGRRPAPRDGPRSAAYDRAALARDKALALRQQLKGDVDPLEAKREAKQAKLKEQAKRITFKKCAELFLDLHEGGWSSEKHRQQWRSSLKRFVYPSIGELSVQDVDQAAVMKIIEPLLTAPMSSLFAPQMAARSGCRHNVGTAESSRSLRWRTRPPWQSKLGILSLTGLERRSCRRQIAEPSQHLQQAASLRKYFNPIT